MRLFILFRMLIGIFSLFLFLCIAYGMKFPFFVMSLVLGIFGLISGFYAIRVLKGNEKIDYWEKMILGAIGLIFLVSMTVMAYLMSK